MCGFVWVFFVILYVYFIYKRQWRGYLFYCFVLWRKWQ